MPIFNKDLPENNKPLEGFPQEEEVYKGKVLPDVLHPSVPNLGSEFSDSSGSKDVDVDDIFTMNSFKEGPAFGPTLTELSTNKRYDYYKPGVNYEDIYARTQPWYKQLGNGIVKMGAFAVGTFAQSFNSIPETVNALAKLDLKELSGKDSYVTPIDDWYKNLEDAFPNYYSDYEKAHPFKSILGSGFANTFGDKFLKNLGFMGGAIAGALVQDAVVGLVTEGLGEIPLLANQIGRASLAMNKLFSSERAIGRALGATEKSVLSSFLESGVQAGRTTAQLSKMESLAQLAASRKVGDQFRYGLNLWTSALTESGVESRDGYRTLKNDLIDQYKLDNFGIAPSGKDLKDIEDIATSSMNARMIGNLGILLVSNAIQFENILRPFSSARKGLNSPVFQEIAGKRVALQEGLMGGYSEVVPKTMLGRVSRSVKPYIPEILTEGVYEEGGQYAVERGTYDYYKTKYIDGKNNKSRDDVASFIDSLKTGLVDQFSTTAGWENMFLGALTAALTGKAKSVYSDVKGTGTKAQVAAEINNLNSHQLTGVFKTNFENAAQQVEASKDMEEAVRNKDIFTYKNAQFKSLFSWVNSRLQSNRYGLLEDEIKLAKELSDEQFKQMFGFDANSNNKSVVNEYLSMVQEEADKIKSNYDKANEYFVNPYKYIRTPKTNAEITESENYNKYESYKAALTYFPSLVDHANKREGAIALDLLKINSLLSIDGVKRLGSIESILGIANEYETEAKNILGFITESTNKEDRKKYEDKAKALRNLAEKIYNLTDDTVAEKDTASFDYVKLFNTLLNFESNGRDTSNKDGVLTHPLDLEKVMAYAVDLNRLDNMKKEAGEAFDILADPKKGFDEFSNAEERKLITPKNAPGSDLTPGREFQTKSLGKYKTKKVADNRYLVIGPDKAVVSAHETKEEALATSKYLNENLQNLLKVKLVRDNGDGTVRITDSNGDVQDIPKANILKYTGLQTEGEKQEIILKRESVKKALEETSDPGEITRDIDSGNFEPDPKKTKEQIPNSTKPPVEGYSQDENTPLAEHHLRANRFGSRFYSFSNVNNFRGVIVTQENETKVGLPGLTQWLKDEGTDPDVETSQTIVLVVKGVDPVTGETYFVGENGEKLDTPSLQTAIYQTFPISLTWSGGGSMFRNEDLGQSEAITKEYNNWRTSTLKNPSENLYKILASFGTPQYVKELNDQGRLVNDNLARISVEDSGLISEGRLSTHRVIGVPTTDGAFLYGSSTFNNVKGVPLLFSNGGAVRLRNKTFSKNEAELIYTVIEKLSTNLLNDGNLRSGESVFLYNWLKSVIYWGTPETITGERKKAASSSVFFENGFLLMGKEETKFSIKPVDLAANKDEIVKLLQNMYGNVNSTLVTGGNKGEWNKSYTEIIAITDQGIQTREWKNYQTFLLSSKNPDGSNRNPESIPLTTRIRPIVDKQDTNRKGIYFTVIDKNSTVSEKPVKPVATPPPTTPPTASSSEGKSSKKFDLKNKDAENIIESKIGKFPFVIDIDKFNESGGLEGINLPDPASDIEYSNSLEKALVKLSAFPSMGLTEDMSNEEAFPIVENVIRNLISKAVKAQIEEEKPASSTPTAPTPVEGAKPVNDDNSASEDLRNRVDRAKRDGVNKRGRAFSLMLENESGKMSPEEWAKTEAWIKENFPNIPVYRVKNYILASGGRKAHGMFENGAIYLSENSQVGTIYHEVFHAVWQSLTSAEERTSIEKEFKQRKGTFLDRKTMKDVSYSEATYKQMEEKLAEEFRDHIQENKVVNEPKSWIGKLFRDIINFFKTFFTGKDSRINTEKLFNKIGTGYYAGSNAYETELSFAKKGLIDIESVTGGELADYELSDVFTGEQLHDIMQHMTYATVADLITEDKGLFTINKIPKKELYVNLADELADIIAEDVAANEETFSKEVADAKNQPLISLYEKILYNWEDIIDKHQEYLNSYGIEFDENDDLELSDSEKSKEDPYGDPRKIDNMRKANAAIKLLFASIPIVDSTGKEVLSKSFGGYTLYPMSELFMGVMNRTHTSRSVDEMLNRIKQMGEDDPKYVKLYKALLKSKDISDVDSESSLQLLSALWRSFKKQSPAVKTVYILEDGTIQVGDANFTVAARQVADEFLNGIKKAIADGTKYFVKSADSKSYIGNKEAINKNIKEDNLEKQVNFLREINIDFDIDKLKTSKYLTMFSIAVNGIRTSIAAGNSVVSIGGRTLSITGRLRELAEVKAILDNPEFNSTYYNVNGELTQTFIGTNPASDLYNALSQVNNISELAGTQYAYLLTDSFARNSTILWRIFDKKSGDRIENSENLMEVGYADGTVNQELGKQIESSKLNFKQRFLQEINLNLQGYYLNLVPGDAKIEWMMYMGNLFSKNDILLNYNKVFDVFKGYLDDEIQLTNEPNRILAKNRDGNTLRFFSSILEEDKELQKEILEFEGTIDVLYEAKDEQGVVYGERINNAVLNFINRETGKLRATLVESGSLKESEGKFTTDGLAFGQTEMTEEELNNQLFLLSVNYAVNNIELHKVLYSDPYFYSDELKRIKNFSSPRQAIVNNSLEMNSAYHKVWNKGLKTDDDAYTNFEREYFRAITLKDVLSINNLYKGESPWEETDGGGMITLKALRQFKIRAGEWDTDQERQYKYDMVWKKNHDGKIKLTKSEKRILKEGNPGIKRTYTPIKPIVAGNKASGRPWNDVILDKFSLYPLSYRVAYEVNKDANALKLYDKMMKEDVDYAVFKSGRKVGAEKEFPLYNDKGEFNTELFETEEQKVDIFTPQTVIDVPFAIMSIQSEVPSKDSDEITRGTQMTKLATLDFLQGGVPVDFMSKELDYNERYKAFFNMTEDEKLSYTTPYKGDNLYKRIKENQNILEALVEEGVEQLMEEFGIDRILGENDKTIGFEIKDVTKLADTLKREITKRDVNYNISKSLQGFRNGDVVIEATPMYQQVRNIIYSIADRNVMSPKTKGSTKVQIPSTLFESGIRPVKDGLYSSDVLKFYVNEDGKRVCEVMIAKWFDDNGETDEALIERLNASPELSEMLRGVAFRIPSQKQNSIDVFKIAKFLPKEFGDSVVVPSALVKKSGSDFDIDKLNMYLKHIDVDKNTGEIRLLPFHGIGPTSKAKFRYKSDYKKSLENGYIKSLEGLVSHPLNFNSLTKPNSADPMKNLSREITGKLGFSTFDYNKPGNMLQRRFMSRLRNALVVGKYAIGIAAVNQTNHSLMQRVPMYIDRRKIDGQDSSTKKFLGDGEIKFNKYNTIEVDGELYPSLSMVNNAEGKSISDILSQLIDGYVDISKDTWIIELGITPNVASTWMFLIRIGVPVKTVAYFMNQPLIREYLKELENKGSTWLWDDTLLKSVERRYKGSANITVKTMPNDQRLEYMVGKSLKDVPGKQTLSAAEIKEQKFMLREFLKYAKMGEQLFIVSQGTNFDTSSFNDPFLVFKKLEQLERARKTIISSKGTNKGVDAILDASFLGKMKDGIIESREIISEVLLSDKPGRIRDAMEHILKPYIRMNDRDFIRTSQRAVATLFDWVTQTKSSPKPLNSEIERILIDKKTNVATRVMDFIKEVRTKEDHPLRNNHIIKIISADFSDPGKNEPNNLKIKNKNNKTYDQNQIIFAFKELKNYLASENNKELYDDLVTLSVLQSGINQSSISFTSLLPYEDFLNVYNEVLSDLPVSDIEAFTKLDVFQRTFWTYDDVVPHMKAKYRYDFFGQMPTYNDNMAFPVTIYNAIKEGDIPKLLKINETSKEANYDVIVYTWETSFPSKIKREMRNRGDYSYINKGLFKRVGYLNGQYIYKAINAWGDGMYSREFYDIPRKSVVQNGFIEVNENITDAKIMSYFTGMTEKPKEQEAAKVMTVVEPTVPSSQPATNTSASNVLGSIKLNIIENWVQKGQATTTVRSSSYHDSFYKGDGQYSTEAGNIVNIKYRGQVKVQGNNVVGNGFQYTKDEFAAAEGFGNWTNFTKEAKYAGRTLIDGGSVHLYDIKPQSSQSSQSSVADIPQTSDDNPELDIDLIADSDFKEFLEYETDILSYETLNEAIQTEEDLYTYLDEFETSSAIIDRVNKFVKEGNNKEAFELMSAIPEVVRLDEMKKPYEINNSTILSEVMGMEEPEDIRNFAEEKVRSIKYIADELRRATLLIKDIKGIISSVTNEVFTSALAKFAKKHDFKNGRAMSEILESYKNDPAATIDMIKDIYENC